MLLHFQIEKSCYICRQHIVIRFAKAGEPAAQLSLVSGMPLPSVLWRLGHVHVWHAAARRHCCGMKNIGTAARTKESKQGDINSEGPSVALVMPGGSRVSTFFAHCPVDSLRGSSDKIETIQRRLAWPLRKDDTHKSRSVTIFLLMRD